MLIRSYNNYFKQHFTYYKASFVKIVNIFFANSILYNCKLYKVKLLLIHVGIFVKNLLVVNSLIKTYIKSRLLLYKIQNLVITNRFCVTNFKKNFTYIFNTT